MALISLIIMLLKPILSSTIFVKTINPIPSRSSMLLCRVGQTTNSDPVSRMVSPGCDDGVQTTAEMLGQASDLAEVCLGAKIL
jgi:hypothetical protein